jgi:hypothetical protein
LNIGGWHPGKIVIVWVLALASYPILPAIVYQFPVNDYRAGARLVWFMLLALAGTITWIWLTNREKPN